MNQLKQPWHQSEAIRLIQSIYGRTKSFNYHLALTGSVLSEGFSDNDLDLVLYPVDDFYEDYRPVLDFLKQQWGLNGFQALKRPEYTGLDYKLVISTAYKDGRRIDLFLPNFTFAGRLDSFPVFETKHYTDRTLA